MTRDTSSGIDCPECGEHNSDGNKFCESCGVSLAVRKGDGDGRPTRRALTREERAEKIEAQRTLSNARQKLGYIRWFLRFAAIGFAMQAAVPEAFVRGADPEVLTVVSWITGSIAAVYFVGSLFLHRHPFAWTVGLAGFLTVDVLVSVAYGVWPIIEAIVMLGMWGAVPLMASASRIIREHDGEYTTEHLKRRVGRDVGPSDARQHAAQKRRAQRTGSLRTYAMIGGAMVVVVGVGLLLFQLLTASATIESRVDEFTAAFESGDFTKVQAMCTLEERRESWYKVERVLAREGWHPSGAPLGEPVFESKSDRWAEVQFDLPRGVMKTAWSYENSAWQIDRFRFSGLRDE